MTDTKDNTFDVQVAGIAPHTTQQHLSDFFS